MCRMPHIKPFFLLYRACVAVPPAIFQHWKGQRKSITLLQEERISMAKRMMRRMANGFTGTLNTKLGVQIPRVCKKKKKKKKYAIQGKQSRTTRQCVYEVSHWYLFRNNMTSYKTFHFEPPLHQWRIMNSFHYNIFLLYSGFFVCFFVYINVFANLISRICFSLPTGGFLQSTLQ